MKHGPIALVDRETPCVFVAPCGVLHAKTLSNVEEARYAMARSSRSGPKGTTSAAISDISSPIPDVLEIAPALARGRSAPTSGLLPALLRGCDIDKPLNLAKSVTVE